MRTEVIAHRGAYHRDFMERGVAKTAALYRENSLPALLVAAVRGYPVELDVRSTRDGRALVSHDDVIAVGTDESLSIGQTSLPLLWTKRIVGLGAEQVPMLTDVFSSLGWRVHLHLELKAKGSSLATFAALCEAGVTDAQVANGMTVSSFSLSELERFHAKVADAPLAWLRSSEYVVEPGKLEEELRSHYISAVHLALEDFSEELAEWYLERNVKVRVFTVNDPAIAINLANTGLVDGIFTDFPGEIASALLN